MRKKDSQSEGQTTEKGKSRKRPPKKSAVLPDEGKMYGKDLNFAAAEAYKLLRANILFALPDEKKCRIIGITSSCSGEGKSTTSLNLSYMLAEAGRKVLLVEADMRRPSIARRLGLKGAPGLSNLAAGLCGNENVVQESGIQENLKILASGEFPPNPSELLGTERMRSALESLCREYDFILLDLPPVIAVSDALVASKLADGMLMVVRQGYTSRSSVSDAMRRLQYVEAKVLGFVMTHSEDVFREKSYRGHKKYGYGYYEYGYGKNAGEEGKKSYKGAISEMHT